MLQEPFRRHDTFSPLPAKPHGPALFAQLESDLQSHGDPHPVTFLFAHVIKNWLQDESIDVPDLQQYPTHLCQDIAKAFRNRLT
jgi:hypothetical protein